MRLTDADIDRMLAEDLMGFAPESLPPDWSPTTNAAHAHACVCQMANLGWRTLNETLPEAGEGEFLARFGYPGHVAPEVRADTRERARCHAILAAYDVGVGTDAPPTADRLE